jgi:hypothetical protein
MEKTKKKYQSILFVNSSHNLGLGIPLYFILPSLAKKKKLTEIHNGGLWEGEYKLSAHSYKKKCYIFRVIKKMYSKIFFRRKEI